MLGKSRYVVEVLLIGKWVDVSHSSDFSAEWRVFSSRVRKGYQARFVANV